MSDGMSDRPDPSANFARPIGPVAAAGWSAAFLMIFVFIGSVFAAVRPGSERDGVTAAMLYAASILIVLLIVVRVHAPETELRDVTGARPLGFVSALLAAMLGASAYFPLGAVEAFTTRKFLPADKMAEYAQALAEVPHRERIAGTIALVLVAPVADEIFFRGALTTGLVRDRGRLVAAVVTALAFAFVSAANDLHYVPLYVAMGLVFAHARLATGSLLGAIAAHLGYRGAELAHALRAHGTIDPLVTGDTPASTPKTVLLAACAIALFCGLLLVRIGDGEPRAEPSPEA
jgi:membrane protease YdiL (CAAX protease family)